MPLKYQTEIDDLQLSISCPTQTISPNDIEAFRFCFNPIEHDLNFLPNVVFDRRTSKPFNFKKATEDVRCSRCGASFYTTLKSAVNKWSALSDQIRENLAYTHIANGILNSTDGVMKQPDKTGHFGFYESDIANLPTKFRLITKL